MRWKQTTIPNSDSHFWINSSLNQFKSLWTEFKLIFFAAYLLQHGFILNSSCSLFVNILQNWDQCTSSLLCSCMSDEEISLWLQLTASYHVLFATVASSNKIVVLVTSIHFLPLNPSVGSRGGWSLSQQSSGDRRGTPWTGRQSITGPVLVTY